MRTRGSARFAPYYKVQEYDPRSAVWIDVQKAHPTLEAAGAASRPGVQVANHGDHRTRPAPAFGPDVALDRTATLARRFSGARGWVQGTTHRGCETAQLAPC